MVILVTYNVVWYIVKSMWWSQGGIVFVLWAHCIEIKIIYCYTYYLLNIYSLTYLEVIKMLLLDLWILLNIFFIFNTFNIVSSSRVKRFNIVFANQLGWSTTLHHEALIFLPHLIYQSGNDNVVLPYTMICSIHSSD